MVLVSLVSIFITISVFVVEQKRKARETCSHVLQERGQQTEDNRFGLEVLAAKDGESAKVVGIHTDSDGFTEEAEEDEEERDSKQKNMVSYMFGGDDRSDVVVLFRVTSSDVWIIQVFVGDVQTRVMHQDNISSYLYKSVKRKLLAGCQDSDQQVICCTVGKSMPYNPAEMSRSSHCQRPRRASTASSKVVIRHGGSEGLQLTKINKEAQDKDAFTYSWQKVSSDRDRQSSDDIAGVAIRSSDIMELKESVILLQNLHDEFMSIDPTRSKIVSKHVDKGTGTDIGTTNARRFQATTHQTVSEPAIPYPYLTSYHHLTNGTSFDDESSSPRRRMLVNDHGYSHSSFDTAYGIRQERALRLSRQKSGHSPPTLVAKLMGLEASAPLERPRFIKERTIKNKFLQEGPFIFMMPNDRSSLNVGNYSSSCRHLGVEAAPVVVMKPMFRFCELSSKETANPTVKPLKLDTSQSKKQETVQFSRIKLSSSPSRSYIKKERTSVTNGLRENGKLTQKMCLERSGLKNNKSSRPVANTTSQTKPTLSLPRKPEKMRALPKYHTSISTRVSEDNLRSRSPLQNARSSAKDKKISRRGELKARYLETTISVSKLTEDNKVVDSSQRRRSLPQFVTSPSANPVSEGAADQMPLTSVKARKKKDIYSPCEVMPKLGPEKNSSVSEIELHGSNILNRTTHEDDIKSLLLGSRYFQSRAQQLLHVNPNHHNNHQWQNKNQSKAESFHLILDCSDELLEVKTHHKKLLNHPLCRSYSGRSTSISSVDDLTEEIVVMVQDLRSYTRTGNGVPSADGLYLRLEKDLRCNLMVGNGGWDWGWIDGFCMEDSDQVVCDLEHLLTNMLIEETLTNHLCC